MKKIVLLLGVILIIGCTHIDYPDDFVRFVKFSSDIVDIEEMGITSKDKLIEFADTAVIHVQSINPVINRYYNEKLYVGINGDSYEYIVYIKPSSNGNWILNENVYKLGMPIIIEMGNRDYSHGHTDPFAYRSKQPVILIRANSEWIDSADSSYKGFTILPVADSDDVSGLDFTYSIREI